MEQTTATDWPYDARQDDPLTALRIPVVGTIHPQWCYHIAVCINEDPETPLWHGLRPNDREVELLRSLIDYERDWYREGYVASTLDARPFDIDSGINTLTLIKRGEGDWAYRRSTWEYGPIMVPDTWQGKEEPLGLAALADRIHNFGDQPFKRWADWKAAHPEVWS